MAHRSNQAVASQDQAAPQPPAEDPPPRRRWLIGWATALAALGISTAILAGGLWFTRFSIAELLIGAALTQRGAAADFQVVALDFNHAVLANVRFGAENAPDAAIQALEARWGWNGVVPQIRAVRVVEPRLRLRLDQSGRVSVGALDHVRGEPSARRASIPQIRLDIEGGQALIEAPFGTVTATFRSSGTLGRDFNAIAQIAPTTRPGERYALRAGSAELLVVSRDENIAFRLNADAERVLWNATDLSGGALRVMGTAPLDLARYDVEAAWRVADLTAPRVRVHNASGAIGFEGVARAQGLEPDVWQAQLRANAAQLSLADNAATLVRIEGRAEGRETRGQGSWTLGAEDFVGFALTSNRPSAAGSFTLVLGDTPSVQARADLTLADSRLSERARQRIRDAFPNIPQAPVGPTFAQAEAALNRAAERFDLTLPLQLQHEGARTRLVVNAPIEARAASGALLRIRPLRQDFAALAIEWPELNVQGVAAIELSGGGAPTASLLLDRVAWAPEAPFEADGTLSLANWQADGASIATDELGLSLSIAPQGGGTLLLRGPTRITGPLGEGDVRDMVATLDLAVNWGDGWRVAPRGCVPVRMGALNAAGLSFANGAFALCPLDGALIAANARGRLSGGFAIETLGLNGRMAGPDGQPARLSARRVTGRFGGVEGDIALAMQADAPRLAITMAEDRMLTLVMSRLTADARIADSWRVEGGFDDGVLTDPALPGAVSAIAGRWSAAPEDGEPIIRVVAGEALMTAAEPADETQRPLFHTLRLVEMSATFRDGRVTADGGIVLEEGARQLAQFTAFHDVSEGAGGAEISAAEIVFDAGFQPYQITELARGLIDNVRGPIALQAGITWSRDNIRSSGIVRINGVSLATSTIPDVRDVRGEVFFDDLFALTTPPGQRVRVASLNPGVTVRNGRVQFQLLDESRVSIESAEFDFASGTLAMTPTTITLGADETAFVLTLRDVDATTLLQDLNVPDVNVTGRVEGTFPLRLTRRSAFIDNGVLTTAGGGLIAYTGDAGANATGTARVAFDALREFRYEELSLTLNGDLNGDVVSEINFRGVNSGEPIDLGPVARIPGTGRVTVRGVPFVFNVSVRAPFRRLAETAATITDPGSLIERGRAEQDAREQNEPVDQPPAPPR